MKYLDYNGLQYFWSKLKALFQNKQDTLVSGTNIKTVNGESLLGNGNIVAGDPNAVKYVSQSLTDAQKTQARTNIGAADVINGITSVDVSVDNTSGTPAASATLNNQHLSISITGIKGDQGNTGSSVEYPFELVNNRTTDDATKGLSAAEGKRLGDDISWLLPEVFEDGFYLVDSERNIGFYVDENGIAAFIMSVLSTLFTTTTEDGFYIIDSDRNIGFMVNTSGAHSANLVEY